MDTRLGKVLIAGLGLIGGSIGLALKERNAAQEIIGMDADRNTLQRALELGAVDRIVPDISGELAGIQLVVLAVPLDAIGDVLTRIVPLLPEGCIVTDVTSVKGKAIRAMQDILPAGIHYIGGHPMTGSERCGIQAADPSLFENTVYVLTPKGGEPPEVINTLSSLIHALGAVPILLEPQRHDSLAAMISHMPYLAAVCLNLAVSRMDKSGEALMLAAGGFRDITRVASSHPGMWSGICAGNRDALLDVLDIFMDELSHLQRLIGKGDWNGMEQSLERAKAIRDSIPDRPSPGCTVMPGFRSEQGENNLKNLLCTGYGKENREEEVRTYEYQAGS